MLNRYHILNNIAHLHKNNHKLSAWIYSHVIKQSCRLVGPVTNLQDFLPSVNKKAEPRHTWVRRSDTSRWIPTSRRILTDVLYTGNMMFSCETTVRSLQLTKATYVCVDRGNNTLGHMCTAQQQLVQQVRCVQQIM